MVVGLCETHVLMDDTQNAVLVAFISSACPASCFCSPRFISACVQINYVRYRHLLDRINTNLTFPIVKLLNTHIYPINYFHPSIKCALFPLFAHISHSNNRIAMIHDVFNQSCSRFCYTHYNYSVRIVK